MSIKIKSTNERVYSYRGGPDNLRTWEGAGVRVTDNNEFIAFHPFTSIEVIEFS